VARRADVEALQERVEALSETVDRLAEQMRDASDPA
jgi:polyhydroxyalkanoate synthesis regulator phasin